jgi:outer membrane lipoprotein SlyB
MKNGKLTALASAIAMLTLGACSTNNPAYQNYPTTATYPAAGTTTNVIAGYGTVQSIELVPRESTTGTGIGTVAGAVVGGLVGHQIGSGAGQTAATIAGAAGGAMAGRAIENNTQSGQQVYRISLRMDDGSVQNLVQESTPSLRIGDRVRVVNGVVERL